MSQTTEAMIHDLLNDLSRLQEAYVALIQKRDTMKAAAIPLAVQQHLDAIEAEYSATLQTHRDTIAALELQVRVNVLACGKSVKGEQLHAVYTKGRVHWDDAFLRGFGTVYPEILQGRDEGDPSVTLRAIKQPS
jgi:hypothetical protein